MPPVIKPEPTIEKPVPVPAEDELPDASSNYSHKQAARPSKHTSSTPSIKDALNSLAKPKASLEEENSGTDTVNDPEEISSDEIQISIAELQKNWQKFILELQADQPRMYNALKDQSLELTDEHVVQINFHNNAQIEDFKQNIKPSLLASLRSALQVPQLEITEILNDIDDSPQRKHYTDQDKLKHMMEKNPLLKKLYQDFNLDFE